MPTGPSAPFASRELNGETLLDEVRSLRQAAVAQKHLDDCALVLRSLRSTAAAELPAAIRQVAQARFGGQPEIAGLLVRWAAKVRTQQDVEALCLHLQRLALTSALLSAMYRGAGRLPKGAR